MDEMPEEEIIEEDMLDEKIPSEDNSGRKELR